MNGVSRGTEARPCQSHEHDVLEERHISSSADHWQLFLHLQHFLFSIMPPVDLSLGVSGNEVVLTEFRYCSRDLTDLMKVECMCRIWPVLMLHCLVATGTYVRSFCEFLVEPQ